jgi:hypothetical protein
MPYIERHFEQYNGPAYYLTNTDGAAPYMHIPCSSLTWSKDSSGRPHYCEHCGSDDYRSEPWTALVAMDPVQAGVERHQVTVDLETRTVAIWQPRSGIAEESPVVSATGDPVEFLDHAEYMLTEMGYEPIGWDWQADSETRFSRTFLSFN